MSPVRRSHSPHKSSGLWPLPLKLPKGPKHSLPGVPAEGPFPLPGAPELYLEDPLQRLHIAAFALHDGAQDVPPDHLLGSRARSAPAPAMAQSSTYCAQNPGDGTRSSSAQGS